MVGSSYESLRAVVTLILFGIKLQSRWTGFADVSLVVMYGVVSRANTILVVLVPDHVVRTTFAHFVLSVVFGGPRRTFSALFIDFVIIFIFIGVAAWCFVLLLVEGLNKGQKEKEPKYFFIHFNKNYIWNSILINLHFMQFIHTYKKKNQ